MSSIEVLRMSFKYDFDIWTLLIILIIGKFWLWWADRKPYAYRIRRHNDRYL